MYGNNENFLELQIPFIHHSTSDTGRTLVRYLPTNIPYESLMKEIVKSLVLGYRSKESCKNRIGR